MPVHFRNIFLPKNKPSPIILVSGLPRSGTSMMMKVLESGGLEVVTDQQRSADENNPNGYYELERVKNLKVGDFDWLAEVQGKVVKVISALLEFLPNRYQYQIIFMRRNMAEVLSSQRQMLARNGKQDDQVSDGKLADLYEDHLSHVESWLDQQPNMRILYMSYNAMVKDPIPNLEKLNQFLGGSLNVEAMRQVIDQNLYRERRSG